MVALHPLACTFSTMHDGFSHSVYHCQLPTWIYQTRKTSSTNQQTSEDNSSPTALNNNDPAGLYTIILYLVTSLLHCILILTVMLCWWEPVLARATRHPPHSYIHHIHLPRASSHIANVQMKCRVFQSFLCTPLILTPVKSPETAAITCCPGTSHHTSVS